MKNEIEECNKSKPYNSLHLKTFVYLKICFRDLDWFEVLIIAYRRKTFTEELSIAIACNNISYMNAQ